MAAIARLLGIVATLNCGAGLAGAQEAGDTAGRFTIYKLQHAVGAETYRVQRTGPGLRTLTANWAFRYIGSPVALADTLIMANDEPSRFVAHGQTSTLTDVDLTIDIAADSALVVDRGHSLSLRRASLSFPINSYPAASVEGALFHYWRKAGRPKSLSLLPRGAVSFEYRGVDTLFVSGRREAARRYAVRGLLWGVQSMWATSDNSRLIAVVSGDAELDRFEEVREGYGEALPQLVVASVRDGIAEIAEKSAGVRPIHEGTFALVGARIIDGSGSSPLENATIVVADGRIESVGPSSRVRVPKGVRTLNVTGKTIIPGLWDMHVHFEQVEWPAAQLAAGVTTARDVGNEMELATGLREAIQGGRMPGPRLLLAGLIDGAPNGLGVHLAGTDSDAIARVREYAAAGYQQIKIYSSVPPALVSTIASEAHRLGLTVTGHVPSGMNAFQFVEAGADQINHFGYVLAVLAPPVPRGQPRPPIDTASELARNGISFFLSHGTVLDPTLARSEQGAHPKDSSFSVYEPGAARAPPELRDVLDASGSPAATAPARMASLARNLPIIGALHTAGIPIVAGTDLVVPGYSIYRELELEVRSGLTPMQAIQAATIVPARVMRLDKDSGTIQPGKRADLLILDADPLIDISNIRRVNAVVANGRMFDPAPLWEVAGFAR